MAELTRWGNMPLAPGQGHGQLSRSTDRMELATLLGAAAMRELSALHRYSVDKVARALAEVERIKQTEGGRLSPVERAALEAELEWLTRQYLTIMTQLTGLAGERIVHLAATLPYEVQQGVFTRLLEG